MVENNVFFNNSNLNLIKSMCCGFNYLYLFVNFEWKSVTFKTFKILSFKLEKSKEIVCFDLLSWSVSENTNKKVDSNRMVRKRTYRRTKPFFTIISLYFLNSFENATNIMLFFYLYPHSGFYSFILVISGDVERNPGPTKIITFNARGLKDYHKLKRFLNKLYGIFMKNPDTVVMVQESHLALNDQSRLACMWRYNYAMSPAMGSSAGCIVFYNGATISEPIYTFEDNDGRILIITCKNASNQLTTIVNIHAPNNHNIEFFKLLSHKIDMIVDKYDTTLIVGGDFNITYKKIDSVNRICTTAETKAKTLMEKIINKHHLFDSFRLINSDGGFTWSRGPVASRLDYVFLSKTFKKQIKTAEIDWTFEKSDHAAVIVTVKDTNIKVGPGISRVSIASLECPNSLVTIKRKLSYLLQQINKTWSPHTTLEFVKMSIRSLLGEATAAYNKVNKTHKTALESELTYIRQNLELAQLANDNILIEKYSETVCSLEVELDHFRLCESKKLADRAKTKWYQEGEKSNKYFLNIIKSRTNKMLKSSIIDVDGEERSDTMDMLNIAENFYKKLYQKIIN